MCLVQALPVIPPFFLYEKPQEIGVLFKISDLLTMQFMQGLLLCRTPLRFYVLCRHQLNDFQLLIWLMFFSILLAFMVCQNPSRSIFSHYPPVGFHSLHSANVLINLRFDLSFLFPKLESVINRVDKVL